MNNTKRKSPVRMDDSTKKKTIDEMIRSHKKDLQIIMRQLKK